jgi:hypothetical protein
MIKGFKMSEEITIVQSITSGTEACDYYLDDKGHIYKIETGKTNELTFLRQKINIVIPDDD